MTDLLTPQPPPTNEGGDLWADIIAREDDPAIRAAMTAPTNDGVRAAVAGIVYAEGLGDSSAASWVRVCFRAALRTLVMEVGK